jgi:hypothetical protein
VKIRQFWHNWCRNPIVGQVPIRALLEGGWFGVLATPPRLLLAGRRCPQLPADRRIMAASAF